ncbi:hypothetical protein [Desulfofalx alkaliphila]|uniref:hypothetical protein n=1 Tax=Desulfofalx alkaliphila TaxID=105483 RepID=UPI000AC9F769|nr:hypothetical protein [Desulfofalx alkaliphila]
MRKGKRGKRKKGGEKGRRKIDFLNIKLEILRAVSEELYYPKLSDNLILRG